MKTASLVFILFLFILPCRAQEVSYVQAVVTGDFVSIYYTLESHIPGQVFEIDVFSSHNDFQEPLKHVRGEVGPDILPGKMKKIEWGVKNELEQYSGEVTFEVRAKVMHFPVTILFPQSLTHMQRGHTYKLTWEGGLPDENLLLTLQREGNQPIPIAVVANNGSYEWKVPKNLPEATNYYLEISGWGDKSKYKSKSGLFAVKRRVPHYLKEK